MFLALSISDVVFIMLINVKMPTILGILTFMSRTNFVLSLVKHEKGFITLGPDNFVPHIFFFILTKTYNANSMDLNQTANLDPHHFAIGFQKAKNSKQVQQKFD